MKPFLYSIILAGLWATPTLSETVKIPKDVPVSSLKEMVFQWKKCSNSNGLNLYWSKVEGSPIIAFRGEGIVDAPIEKVASIIIDTTRGTEWIDSLLESRVVRDISPTEFVEYDHVGTPFIMANRDFVSHVSVEADPKTKRMVVSYKPTEDSLAPILKKYVRGVMTCEFKMVPMTMADETYVETEIHCDPKGSVAKWLVNFFQQGWPQTTFESLRKQAKKPDIQILPIVENLLQKPAVKLAQKPKK
jgi:hypothetical protein